MSEQSSKRSRGERRARASLVDVAKAVGVSATSVSNAYNRPDQLSGALRDKILGAAAELGYSGPDPLARNFRRGRAEALGIVVAEPFPYPLSDPYAVQVLHGVAEALEASQLALVLVPGGPARHGHAQAVRHAAVDGFILHSLLEHDALLQTALRRNLPAVVIDGPALPAVDFVGIDDRAGAARAAQHLIELGHREIGVLCFRLTSHTRVGLFKATEIDHTSSTVPRNRLHGCFDVLAGVGLEPGQVPVMECGMTSEASGREGMAVLLDNYPQLTAVIAFSDMLALGAKQEARARGMQVPEQLSIVGFDDVLPESEALTTVRQPNRLKGRIAVGRLLELLVDHASTTRHQMLPTELVVRGSTSGPRPL